VKAFGCAGKLALLEVISLAGYANLTGLSLEDAVADIGKLDGYPVLV